MKRLIYSILMGLLLCPGAPFHLHTQNNPFKIHDSIYIEYKELRKQVTSPEIVEKANALSAKARMLGDKKGECVALTITVINAFYGSDSLQLVKAVQHLQQVSRANGYLQYYYYAYNDYVYWLLNHNHTLKALQAAEQMQRQADKDKNDYGIYSCLKAQGYIYYTRRDLPNAIRYHKEALQYQLAYMPEQDASLNYGRLADLHRQAKQLDKAMQYAEKGIKVAKTATNRKRVMLEKCKLLFEMGREDEFMQYYAQCQEEMARSGKASNNTLKILDCLCTSSKEIMKPPRSAQASTTSYSA